MKDFTGKWALITGASSGLGADFARQLALGGTNLVITARRLQALTDLRTEVLKTNPGIRVEVLTCDLSLKDGPETLLKQIQALNISIDILINNAGYGAFGPFDAIDWEKEQTMLNLDITALVHLTKIFAGPMKHRGWGRILLLGSIAAFQPSPLYASYAGAKAFVLSYGIAVNQELKGTGVTCTVLNPGVTATEFLQVAEQKPTPYQRMMMMQSSQVVRTGLLALHRRRKTVVPGVMNKATAVMTRFMGRGFAAAVAQSVMK